MSLTMDGHEIHKNHGKVLQEAKFVLNSSPGFFSDFLMLWSLIQV